MLQKRQNIIFHITKKYTIIVHKKIGIIRKSE